MINTHIDERQMCMTLIEAYAGLNQIIRGLCKTIDDHIHGFHNYFIGGKKNESAVSEHRRRSKLRSDVQETTLQAGRMEEEKADEGFGTGEEICPTVTEDSKKNLV